jgi:hypothetical protein
MDGNLKDGFHTDKDGVKRWYKNGNLHREDGPAIEYANGDKYWYLNGNRHREDGPAIERASGDRVWYLNDNRHREDGPAIEYASGSKFWYLNGKEITVRPMTPERLQKIVVLL